MAFDISVMPMNQRKGCTAAAFAATRGLPVTCGRSQYVAATKVSAYVYSTVALVLGRTDLYYDVSVAVILVVSFGGYYESGRG